MGPLRSSLMCGLVFLAICFASACSNSAPPITVALSPSAMQTDQGQTINITAMVSNDSSSSGVSWRLSGPGSLSGSPTSVTYTAPTPSSSPVQQATVTATSVKDPTKTASVQITVNPLPFISFSALPSGTTGTPYSQSVTTTGGTAPFTWSIVYGAMPNGLNIGPTTGTISGTPTSGGTWYFEVQLTDAAGVTAQQPFLSIEVFSNVVGGNPVPFLNQPLVPDTAAPGGPGFTLTPVPASGYTPGSVNMVAIGDFNGDGKPDLAVTGPGDLETGPASIVTILLGNGDGTFTVPNNSTFPTGSAPQAITVANLNGDGKLDLAIANYQSASVTVLLGNGDGTFTPATSSPITVGNGPYAIATADLNGDGKLDLAVANYLDNTLTILQGNGDGTFTPAAGSPVAVGAGPSSIAVADFNGSGRLGLAVTSLSGNTVSILVQQP